MTRFGGYADVVCVPVKQIFPRPAGLSALEGAAIPVNYFTAWQLVVVMGALKANETVLIHSVGGGVGIAATQIAKHVGARVIGTASAGKHDEMRALGVDHLIDYRTEDFETRTREITRGRGVELILDAVGGESWKKGYRVLAPTGRLGMFGVSSLASGKERNILSMLSVLANTPWFQFNPLGLMNANKGVFGVNLGHMWDEIDRLREWGETLVELAARGIVRPKVAASFKFDDAPGASLHPRSTQHRQGAPCPLKARNAVRQDDVGCRRSGGKADVLGTRAKYALVSRRCPISGRTAATTPPARGFRGRNRRAPVVSAGRSRRFQRDVALDQRKGAPATNLGITTSILWIHVAYLRAIEPAVSMRLVSLSIGRPRLQVAAVPLSGISKAAGIPYVRCRKTGPSGP